MATSLHLRGVPDSIYQTLVRRATARGMSLRRYAIEVLTQHCALPTMDEWLADLTRLPPPGAAVAGAEAVRQARAEDDAATAGDRRSPAALP
jgi:hypothetical protein